MKNSMCRLAVAVAFLFIINVGCTSETNVPKETSEKSTVMPSGTTDLGNGKAAMTETKVPGETSEKTTAMPSGTTDLKDDKAALTETNLTNESGERTPGQMMETMSESGDDASITALVKAALLDNPSTSTLDAKVETKDGVVTLSGQVNNATGKDLAEKYASNVKGVKNVVNNMTVQ